MLKQTTTLWAVAVLILVANVKLRADQPTVRFSVDETTTEFSVNILSYADFSINWGDGTSDNIPGPTPQQIEVKHTYPTSGARIISITGEMINNLSLNEKAISSITFGDNQSDFQQFKELYINKNNFTNLDLSMLINLDILSCTDNRLTGLDLSNNTKLGRLIVAGNSSLSDLDLSSNPQLSYINAAKTGITSIDLKDNLQLKEVLLHENQLNELDLSGMQNLQKLYCPHNNISSLNLEDSPNLNTLVCNNNRLEELKLNPSVTSLDELECQDNMLSFATLPRVSESMEIRNFNYSPQDSLSMTGRSSGMTIDLSDQISVSGIGSSPVVSRIKWFNARNNNSIPTNSYTEVGGVYTFNLDPDQQHLLRAEIKNNAYPKLTLLKTKVVSLPELATGISEESSDDEFSYRDGIVSFRSEKEVYDVMLMDLHGRLIFSGKNISSTLDLQSFLKKEQLHVLSITNNNVRWVKILR